MTTSLGSRIRLGLAASDAIADLFRNRTPACHGRTEGVPEAPKSGARA
jgi:hypothetical protein